MESDSLIRSIPTGLGADTHQSQTPRLGTVSVGSGREGSDADPHRKHEQASARLERFGERAAAIAHELNNILTVVRTYTHFARQGASHEQRARDLRIVAAAAERGTALTDWLGSITENEPRASDELSAKEFLSAVAVRLQLLTLRGTKVEVTSAPDDVTFRANRARLEHVIASLVLTANQALLGGEFRLGFERRVVEGEDDTALDRESYVVLGIECRGAGGRAPLADGASVKEQMASSSTLLAELLATMNGHLALISENEGAARFEVYLPIAQRSACAMKATAPRVARREGTILIVEDDAAIRLAMSRTLVNAGHTVLEASDGPSAREVLTESSRTVELVVSDGVLPRGGGPDLFAWVRATSPNTAFLLISGREREGAAKASELGVGFLGKPFYPAEFLTAVRRALATPEANPRRAQPATERRVVVIVDDDPDIRESFERLLRECDFETHVAKTGLRALQILSERHVDAVITDQFMPGLDGVGLLELVNERFPACIRILCTGHPASDIVVSAVARGGVHRVLTKTMHAVALRDEVERTVLDACLAR